MLWTPLPTLPPLLVAITSPVSSDDRLLAPTLPARPINNRQEVRQAAQAGEYGGRQVHLVQTRVLVLLQVAVRVAIGLVDHDTYGRHVEQGGGHVVRQVGAQPALPSQQRHQVLLVQKGEEEEGEGEEPEEDSDEEDEVNGALILVGGDGDPQAGSEHDLQDPDDSQKTPKELEDVLPHLRLGRFWWHLSSLLLRSLSGSFFQPEQGGCFLPAANSWWEKMGTDLEVTSRKGGFVV